VGEKKRKKTIRETSSMIHASFHPISKDDEGGRSSNNPRLSSKYEMKEQIVPAG